MTDDSFDAAGAAASGPLTEDVIIDGFFELVQTVGLSGVSAAPLSDHLGVRMAELYAHELGETRQILIRYGERLTVAMLDVDRRDYADVPLRDRLMDLVLQRLEAAGPHRLGIAAVKQGLRLRPDLGVAMLPTLKGAISALCDAAGVDTTLPFGSIRMAGVTYAYLRTAKAWLAADEGDAMAAAQATLDRELDRIEDLARRFDPAARS